MKRSLGIYAAIDYQNSLTNQVVYIFRKKDDPGEGLSDASIEYVAGLLSSRAMLAYYVLRFGEREWRSYPYVTQKILKKLPLRHPDSVSNGWTLHADLTKLVRRATEAGGPISKSLDLSIEEKVAEIYGFSEQDRKRVDSVLNSVQDLRIIRELKS